jgi:hypothetical protein
MVEFEQPFEIFRDRKLSAARVYLITNSVKERKNDALFWKAILLIVLED